MENRSYEQATHLDRHYHEPVAPHEGNHASTVIGVFCLIAWLIMLIVGIVEARQQIAAALVVLVYISIPLFFLFGLAALIYPVWHRWHMDKIKRAHAEIDLQAKQEQVRRENEAHEVRMYLAQSRLMPDAQGNRPFIFNPRTYEIVEVASGNYLQPVPAHLHYETNYSDTSTRPGPEQNLIAAAASLHIPTFAESLASGDVGPGQRDMLFCYEIVEDEVTRQAHIVPIRGAINEQHTQLIVAGSQSGKTTYMASNMAQAAVLGTLFYIIDPHKSHPEKSIAAKMAAYAPWFILPPASSHEEIRQLLKHATKVRDARIAGKPTMYDGYHIMVVVDEVPALMANQHSSDKNIRQLYLDLALFMQSLGIQTAKYGITGLFASQFATKEQLGEIDFRDACMSQLIMRLHPTQAQAMRVLGKEAVREIPKFPKGHGYLLLSDSSETRRVAAGNVTQADLTTLARVLPPSPLISPVQKVDRNQLESRSIIPIRDGVETTDFTSETSEKYDRNQSRNQLEGSLQAKLEQVRQLIASGMVNKADLLVAVWGVRPGSSDKYKQAEQEYKQIMTCLAERGA